MSNLKIFMRLKRGIKFRDNKKVCYVSYTNQTKNRFDS